jgi:hypothetical protein
MPTFLFDKFGMPDFWTPGPIIKEILKKVADSVDKNFPNSKNFVIDTTWVSSDNCRQALLQDYAEFGHVDNLFLCATADIMIKRNFPLPSNPDLKIFQLGSIDESRFEKYRFNFPAISLTRAFKNYTDEELLLTDANPKRFLCYQNKPHIHRQLFTHKIIEAGLMDKGLLSLQKNKHEDFLYPTLQIFSIEEEIDDRFRIDPSREGPQNIEDDKQIPYCLGDIKVWQQCFLTVTAETFHNWYNEHDPSSNWWFVSEKTFKPIIGMRPFVLNGNPKILEHLEAEEFYTFEEYWKDIDFRGQRTMERTVEACFTVVQRICNMSSSEITAMYQDMLPKLQHNRERFFHHAQEQEDKIYTMFK